MQRVVLIMCPLCGIEFEPKETQSNICRNCLLQQTDVLKGITHERELQFCKHCRRYNRPPWVLCERESKDLLTICLKKISGMAGKSLKDAKFIFTEPSTRIIKVQLVVAEDISRDTSLQETTVLEFHEAYFQCDDCKREFTPHKWGAQIQLRQRVDHKKTFFFLEQLIIKHHMNHDLLKIEAVDQGMNLYFKKKSQSVHLLEFLRQYLPVRVKESKEVYSFIKYTFVVDVPRICKDDLVLLPKKLCSQLGGISSLQLCQKVSSFIYLIDPFTMRTSELSAEKYFLFEQDIRILTLKNDSVEFTILDVEPLKGKNHSNSRTQESKAQEHLQNPRIVPCMVEVLNEDCQQVSVRSHLGNVLQPGHVALGYDLNKQNNQFDDLATSLDIVLVRRKQEKSQQQQRKIKLKRLQIEEDQKKRKKKDEEIENKQFDEFLDEVEQDEELRMNVEILSSEIQQTEIQEQKSMQQDQGETNL